MDEYPVLLNGRSAEGRMIFVNADGTAYVELPPEAPQPGAPVPRTGIWPGPTQTVPTPEHMKDRVFLDNPGTVVHASADGLKAVCFSPWGNPPMPPIEIPPPACAAEFARRYREGEGVLRPQPSLVDRLRNWWNRR